MKTLFKKVNLSIVITLLFISLSGHRASAQFFTGGDFNVTFIGGVNIDIAPIVGFKYKNFSAGLSPVILYTATSPTGGLSGQFSYGGRIFFEYDIWKGVFAHAEFQMTNAGYIHNSLGELIKGKWLMGAPIGVGYEHEISKNLWLKAMVLYDAMLDINIDQNSPQANPSVRGGITYVFK